MPIYVYECEKCGYREEQLERLSDPPEVKVMMCCDDRQMKRIIAPTTFILKGPGWSKDGYSK